DPSSREPGHLMCCTAAIDHTMRDKRHVLACLPVAALWCRLALQERLPQVVRGAAREECARTADGRRRMCVTAAGLSPMIHVARQCHRDTGGADAGKAAIERLDTVGMEIGLPQQAIHYRPLYTVAEDSVERVGDDGEAALLMHQLDAALDA